MLGEAGGWREVLSSFETDHLLGMVQYPGRHMVLLLDFDGHHERLDRAKARIPQYVAERVYILGSWREPESLRAANLGSYETIGLTMAKDCHDQTHAIWGHELLRHNATELKRLSQKVRPILF